VVVILLSAAFAGLSGSSAASPAAPAARDVSYLFHAQFDLDYRYDWVQASGDRSAACSYWTDTRGSNAISAGSLRWIPGQLKLPASTRRGILPAAPLITATGSRPQGGRILANARAETTRRLVHRGGTTAGCTIPPTPFVAPQTDCGPRTYETKSAVLLYGGVESGTGTLETLLKSGPRNAIRISVTPAAVQYRNCEMGAFPPAYPFSLPVGLRREHVAKLQALDEGEVVTVLFSRAGHCKLDPDPTSSCHFDLDVTLKIRRWVSGTRFP
jgi:hypothetical protein